MTKGDNGGKLFLLQIDSIGGIILGKQKNYLYCLLFSAVVAMMAAVCWFVDKPEPQVMFQVESVSGTQQIALYDAGEGEHILFLPSYAELEKVSLFSNLRKGIVIDGVAMTEGASCAGFALDEPYALTVNGREAGTIQFCRSANVATMYIDTATGSMKRIHENKEYEEAASVAVYDEDGILSLADGSCYIKGRGNSTWHFEKKPYVLKLSAEQSLLGMSPGLNWVILANAIDVTNLRNKLVYDFAHSAGIEQVPECQYADVFLNGEYNGLYLLAEKVEVEPDRMNLKLSEGDFLCKVEIENRWDILDHPFKTQAGRTVEYVAPELAGNAEYERVVGIVNDMEELIFSDIDLQSVSGFDLDSWVYHYLIDEVFANVDADLASSYFYYCDGAFHSGPIWDYDLTFGLMVDSMEPFDTANAFCAIEVKGVKSNVRTYYDALYQNKSFHNRMADIYQAEFLPLLNQAIDYRIMELASEIRDASAANRMRWGSMYDSISEEAADPQSLVEYLSERMAFLNGAWLEGEQYCSLRLEYPVDDSYKRIYVKKGSLLDEAQFLEHGVSWIRVDTGEEFDFSQPVMEDMILVKQSGLQQTPEPLVTRDYITIASVAALVILMLCFGLVDTMRRRKERRGTDARTKIPS